MDKKRHKPSPSTRETVKALASFKLSHIQIAKYLRISPTTLAKHYEHELNAGVVELVVVAGETIRHAAMRGDTDSAKFILSRIGNCAPAQPSPTVLITPESVHKSIAETAAQTIMHKEKMHDV